MPITELALLRSKLAEPSADTKSTLRQVQHAQGEYSKFPVTYLRQEEDSACFYLLGGWESVAEHLGDWISSAPNQELLGRLQGEGEVEWMFHLDIDPSTSTIPLNAPVVSVSRYFVEASRKAEFDRIFQSGASGLGAYTAPLTYAGGWRIDKEGDDEEFVLFAGWNKVEDHYAFAESEAFQEFGKIKSVLKGVEIKHGHLEKWE